MFPLKSQRKWCCECIGSDALNEPLKQSPDGAVFTQNVEAVLPQFMTSSLHVQHKEAVIRNVICELAKQHWAELITADCYAREIAGAEEVGSGGGTGEVVQGKLTLALKVLIGTASHILIINQDNNYNTHKQGEDALLAAEHSLSAEAAGIKVTTESLSGVAHTVIYHDSIPILFNKLVNTLYIGLVELALNILENISEEFPSAITHESGLVAPFVLVVLHV
ncbi:hypothetical protein EI94DRAFT_1706062 [Lactarius quietus]|nr:hypothetical protein EI94DRAFT_1706062 [Lactarius quietus]